MVHTRAERRASALKRCINYVYDNSKAKRKGIEEKVWEQELKNHMNHLESLGTR